MLGLRNYSWKLACILWSPLWTSLVPLFFENAELFQLFVNCETPYSAKNVLAFVKKITKLGGSLIIAVASRSSFSIYLRTTTRNKESWGEGAVGEREQGKNSRRICPNKCLSLGKRQVEEMK